MKFAVVLTIIAGWAGSTLALETATNVVGGRPGYVFDVEGEKNSHEEPLVLIAPPPPEPSLNKVLFNEKLTKDIRDQYEYRFGHTAMEQTINAPQNRESEYYYNGDTTVQADKYNQYQRSFAEYVIRRVGETQADNYFKSSSSLKSVYEAKDTLSNVNVKTQSGYKFKWGYNISGNTMNVEVENPYHIETKLRVQFKQFSTDAEEQTLNLGYTVNTLWRLDSYYKFYDGVAQLVALRRITSSVSGTLTGSATTNDNGPSVRQTLFLVGLSWTQ